MKKLVKVILNKIKDALSPLSRLSLWLLPIAFFLTITYLPKILWNLSFKDYLEFLKILIWPCTVIVILFFFQKVFTYMFFSMDEFNFFGAKGNLKNVNEIILEEVEKKLLEEKEEGEQKKKMKKLNTQINKTKGTADENLAIARSVMVEWKKSTKQNKDTINDLTKENKRLREITSSFSTSPSVSPSGILVPEMGSGEKTTDFKPGTPIIK